MTIVQNNNDYLNVITIRKFLFDITALTYYYI